MADKAPPGNPFLMKQLRGKMTRPISALFSVEENDLHTDGNFIKFG